MSRHRTSLNLIPVLGPDESDAPIAGTQESDAGPRRSLVRAPARPTIVAENWTPPGAAASPAPNEARAGKTKLWLAAVAVAAAVGALIAWLPATPKVVMGLSARQVGLVEAIVFFSGVMSGLSGFGFSAIGAVSLLILPPMLQVPLFQVLSTGNQLLSAGQLREDMPKSAKELWAGPGPCMLGGTAGVPVGIWILFHLPAARLMAIFGTLLTVYAVYSVFKPSRLVLRRFGGGPLCGVLVGFMGGVVGGFTAFPGAAVVVWAGLRGLPKAAQRSVVQPYIILSQAYSLCLVAFLHPSYLSGQFWFVVLLTLPAVVPGTLSGLALYRRVSDLNFKRISYILLGISGLALLAKTCGPAMMRLL